MPNLNAERDLVCEGCRANEPARQNLQANQPARQHARRGWRTTLKLALLGAAVLYSASVHGGPPPGGWTVPPPPAPHKPLIAPASPIVPTAGPSAYLPGAGSVTPTGEYRFEIPIQVPPGPAGMQPDIALTYSSRAGDSAVGSAGPFPACPRSTGARRRSPSTTRPPASITTTRPTLCASTATA